MKKNYDIEHYVSTVSHELRTPLTIIKEGIGLILDGVYGKVSSGQKKTLDAVCENIDRLSRMITTILDLSKIEAGKMDLYKQKILIKDLIEKACAPFRAKAREKGIRLTVRSPKEEVALYVDIDKILQVFTNILGNALKFTPTEGSIRIGCHVLEDNPGYLQIAIRDSGIGIPEKDLGRIFNKFEQARNSSLSKEQGTGLGLSIAKGIIETHAGNIWVLSTEGEGSTFNFTVPIYIPEKVVRDEINHEMSCTDAHTTNMSILSVSIDKIEDLKENLPQKDFQNVVSEIKGVVKNTVRKFRDVSIDDGEEFLMVLRDCNKLGVEAVKNRLETSLNDYLRENKFLLPIKFNLRHASYPEDAHDEESLLKIARGQ